MHKDLNHRIVLHPKLQLHVSTTTTSRIKRARTYLLRSIILSNLLSIEEEV